jgi:hypothetical protein
MLIERAEFRRYYGLLLQAIIAEPLLSQTRVRVPYGVDGQMKTHDNAIGKAWAAESFQTTVSEFNELVSVLKMSPQVGTYAFQSDGNSYAHTIYSTLTKATPLYANRLVGEAFEAINVSLQRDEGNAFPGDSTWTWTTDTEATIDAATLVGNCFDGNGCGTHYFQVDVSLLNVTVRDKGGFVPLNGLHLAPGTIPLPN